MESRYDSKSNSELSGADKETSHPDASASRLLRPREFIRICDWDIRQREGDAPHAVDVVRSDCSLFELYRVQKRVKQVKDHEDATQRQRAPTNSTRFHKEPLPVVLQTHQHALCRHFLAAHAAL
jgi:hypothetical protein